MKNNKRLLFVVGALLSLILSGCSNSAISDNHISHSDSKTSAISHSSNGQSHKDDSSNTSSAHKHTYSDKWSYDEEYHWHNATCGHDVQSSKGKHQFDEWTIDVNPTVKENGHQYKTCSVCGYRVDEIVPATGTLDKIICAMDGTVSFKKRNIDGEIVIPAYVDDIKVEKVGSFSNCPFITAIVILNGPTSIESNAFTKCDSLKTVTMADSIETVGEGIFIECTNLESVVLSNNLTSISREMFYDCRKLKDIEIPDKVTSIESSAFSGCYSLKITTIPNSVTSIGEESFQACSSIVSLNILGNIQTIPYGAFNGCSSLKSVNIPDRVKTIDSLAFANCSSLTSISIPDSVTTIGTYSFSNCSSLEAINFGKGLSQIPDYAFYECAGIKTLGIPNNIKHIGDHAFSGCILIRELIFKEGLESIGDGAFSGCHSLQRVVLLNPETSVSSSAFSGAIKLVQITNDINDSIISENADGFVTAEIDGVNTLINYVGSQKRIVVPSNVIALRAYAFYDSGITSLTLPKELTDIDYSAFDECDDLEEIIVDENNPNFSSYQGILYNKDYTQMLYVPKGIKGDIDVHDGVTVIGYPSLATQGVGFAGCKYVSSVNIPSSVTIIGWYAFSVCESLKSVNIPSSVNTVSPSAFRYCYSLSSIKFPEAVTLGVDDIKSIFNGCYSLVSILIPSISSSYYNLNIDSLLSLVEIINDESESIVSRDENGFITMMNGASKVLVKYVGEQKEVVIPSGINEIRKYAFFKGDEHVAQSKITSVNIPDTVRSIGYESFNCCRELKTLDIPNSVTSIDKRAFCNCVSLESLRIGTGLTNISESLFANCRELKEVTINATNLVSVDKQAFEGCPFASIRLPDSVETIGEYAFNLCTNLESLKIPQATKTIANSAFYCCYSLREIIFNNQLETIGDYAFGQCSLTSVSLPDSVKQIGKFPFYACERIESLTIGGGLETIASNFIMSPLLTNVTIRNGVKTIEANAFLTEHLDYTIIPTSVTLFKQSAFAISCDSVFYEGNEAQWNNIVIEEYNYGLTRSTIYYYVETKPNNTGNYWHYVDGVPTVW